MEKLKSETKENALRAFRKSERSKRFIYDKYRTKKKKYFSSLEEDQFSRDNDMN
jgi:hypothetical protein